MQKVLILVKLLKMVAKYLIKLQMLVKMPTLKVMELRLQALILTPKVYIHTPMEIAPMLKVMAVLQMELNLILRELLLMLMEKAHIQKVHILQPQKLQNTLMPKVIKQLRQPLINTFKVNGILKILMEIMLTQQVGEILLSAKIFTH